MHLDAGDGSTTAPRTYTAHLRWPGLHARSRVTVRPSEESLDGPLESFLTARWRLHTARLGRTWYLPNTHERWPLRGAELLDIDDGLFASVGLRNAISDGAGAPRLPDHITFSDGVSAQFGPPGLARTPHRRR